MSVSLRVARTLTALLAGLAAYAPAVAPTHAAGYPERPVKIIVPYAPGGNTDAIARLASQKLSEALGDQFVVENRPGSSGSLAAEFVARAAPDGYTLLTMSLPQAAILPALMKVKYDTVGDFAPISNIGFNPYVLTINAALPVNSVQQLIDYVKASPAKQSYASGGVATHGNLAMALFLKRTGLDITPVHMRGGSEQINNVVGGHVPMAFLNAADVVQQSSAGRVRLLAVSSPERMPQIPDVPTMIEIGFADFKVVTWNGLVAPKGTPKDIVERLSGIVQKATREAAFKERLAAIGVEALGDDPASFAATIEADLKLWGDLARSVVPRD